MESKKDCKIMKEDDIMKIGAEKQNIKAHISIPEFAKDKHVLLLHTAHKITAE